MGPVEKALGRMGEVKIVPSHKLSYAQSLQIALSNRPFRFGGEVQSSCPTVLSKWQVTPKKVPAESATRKPKKQEIMPQKTVSADKDKKKPEGKENLQMHKKKKK